MKRTILFLLLAVFSVATINAQNSKKVLYVINHQVVTDFDGTQIMNKTICDYEIDSRSGTHIIFTADYTKDNKISSTKIITNSDKVEVVSYDNKGHVLATTRIPQNQSEDEIVYVMDGRIVPYSEIKDMPSSKIVSMTVIKNKDDLDFIRYSKDAIKYGKLDPKCIIKIVTK